MASLLAAIGLGGAAAAPAAAGAAGTTAAASPFITQAAAASPYYAAGIDAAAVPAATAPVAGVPTAGSMTGLFNSSPSFLQGTGINYGQLAAAASSKGNSRDFAPMWNAYMQAQDAAFKTGMTGLGTSQAQAVRDQEAANKLASDLGFTSSGVTAPTQVGIAPGLTQFQ